MRASDLTPKTAVTTGDVLTSREFISGPATPTSFVTLQASRNDAQLDWINKEVLWIRKRGKNRSPIPSRK